MKRKLTPQERLESHIIGEMRDGQCWETDYSPNNHGYSKINIDGKNVFCHRIAWEIHNCEPIPDGMVVRHTCDNPRCINPEHLVLGTMKDNTDDMLQRDRYSPEARGFCRMADGRYQAYIKVGRKQRHLGVFDTPEQAREAYLEARRARTTTSI